VAQDFAKIVASLRRACKPGVWSAGVSLVRAGAVVLEAQSDEEVVLRVRAAGRAVPVQVVIYPGEHEWERWEGREASVSSCMPLFSDRGRKSC